MWHRDEVFVDEGAQSWGVVCSVLLCHSSSMTWSIYWCMSSRLHIVLHSESVSADTQKVKFHSHYVFVHLFVKAWLASLRSERSQGHQWKSRYGICNKNTNATTLWKNKWRSVETTRSEIQSSSTGNCCWWLSLCNRERRDWLEGY